MIIQFWKLILTYAYYVSTLGRCHKFINRLAVARNYMKITWFFVIAALILVPIVLIDSSALQEVAGKIDVAINPGETKTFQWGLVSDSDVTTTLGLSAEGKGAEFLFLPKSVTLDPHQIIYVKVNATIPNNYPGNVTLIPAMAATEFGQTGGATVINIEVKKYVTLNISPNPNPEFKSQPISAPVQQQTPSTTQNVQPTPQQAKQNGLTIISSNQTTTSQVSAKKGGGCLIATAAFGSELSPQVQFLRGIRDNNILTTASGSSFMSAFNSVYYSFSPSVADAERQNPILRESIKTAIYPLLGILQISQISDEKSEFSVIGAGFIVSSLIGATYLWPAGLALKTVRKGVMPNLKLTLGAILVSSIALIGSLAFSNSSALMLSTSALVLSVVAVSALFTAWFAVKLAKSFK
jgi:hypothetical protein